MSGQSKEENLLKVTSPQFDGICISKDELKITFNIFPASPPKAMTVFTVGLKAADQNSLPTSTPT